MSNSDGVAGGPGVAPGGAAAHGRLTDATETKEATEREGKRPMEQENFTKEQTEVLGLLKKHYPQGISTDNAEVRRVADSIVARGTGLVELIDNDQTPTGDTYRLTDAGAEAFREDAEERANEAGLN